MTIQLDHFIVPSRDVDAAARILGELLAAPWEGSHGGLFSYVYVNDGLTLNFIQAGEHPPMHHYCFQVNDEEFDSILDRLTEAGIEYRSSPKGPTDMRINTRYGGRNIYWGNPDNHEWEILTVSYARQ